MNLVYPTQTYLLSNPQDYLFFSPYLQDEVKEIPLNMFENVAIIMTSRNIPEYFEELYVKKDIDGIKRLQQGLDYFMSVKKHTIQEIYNKRTEKRLIQLIENCPSIIDWQQIVENRTLSLEFWEKYIDKINVLYCGELSHNPNIPVEFWEKHIDKIDFSRFFDYAKVPATFWEKYYTGQKVSNNYLIPIEFLEKHLDKLRQTPYFFIGNIRELPVEFWERHIDKLAPDELSNLCSKLDFSAEFWERHIDKLNSKALLNLCSQADLPLEFWEKHLSKFGDNKWTYFSINERLPLKFWEKYFVELNTVAQYHNFYYYANLPVEFWEKIVEQIEPYNFERLCMGRNNNLPEAFFDIHINKITHRGLYMLCLNKNISSKFWEKHLSKIDITTETPFTIRDNWDGICMRGKLSIEFLEKHIKYICWPELRYNESIPIEFFEKYNKKVISCAPIFSLVEKEFYETFLL